MSGTRTEQTFSMCGTCAVNVMSIPGLAPLRLLIGPIVSISMLAVGIYLVKSFPASIAIMSGLGIYAAACASQVLLERSLDRQSRKMMAKLYSMLELDDSSMISDMTHKPIYQGEYEFAAANID
jgi:hypothetical protein